MSLQSKTYLSHGLQVLNKSLGTNTYKMGKVGAYIAALSDKLRFRPELFQKLNAWVEHLTLLRNKETRLINEIVAVEKKHSAMRKRKVLRRAKATTEPTPEPLRNRNRGKSFWGLFFFILLMESDKKRQIKKLNNG